MDSKVSSGEMGDLRCSDLEVPVLTWKTFEEVVTLFLDDITERKGRNYATVTEEDMEACLDNSLHCCIGKVLCVVEERSENSDQLRELIGREVASKVNRSLMKHVSSSTDTENSDEYVGCETPGFHTKMMVYHIAKILNRCILKKGRLKPSDEYLDSNVTEVSEPDEVTSVEELSVNEDKPAKAGVAFPPRAMWMKEKSFLSVFLGKLLDHIAQSTETSVLDMDFDKICKDLRERLVGDTGFILPKTVGNLHHSIFETLCQEFGSAKQLHAAVISVNTEFAEAVTRALRSQLKNSTEISFGNKVKKLCGGGKNKVVPVCDINMPAAHCEVVHLDDNTRLISPEKQHSNISRIFSSMTKFLRKPFDWISGFQYN
ncbi:hypothetical protein PAMP_014764 [Pampus punctatissimus]